MKPDNLDSNEMELRKNKDYMASLDMIAEGAPIYQLDIDDNEDIRDNSCIDDPVS